MLEKGKMCQGTEEALLILWGAGAVDRGPLYKTWVSGW